MIVVTNDELHHQMGHDPSQTSAPKSARRRQELESLPDLLAEIEAAERAVNDTWIAVMESLRGYI